MKLPHPGVNCSWMRDYALNADLALERVEFGVATSFGAFSSSNSRTSASTSSCKRTKHSPRGDRLRCASQIMPKSTFRNGGTKGRTTSSPARTSAITVFRGNKPTASVSATIIFIIATDLGLSGLSKIANETGGECYSLGTSNLVSFKPYLEQFQEALDNQYYLVFLAVPGKKPGLQRVRIETEVSNSEIAAPDNVWAAAK